MPNKDDLRKKIVEKQGKIGKFSKISLSCECGVLLLLYDE
jgi:hypothetical protein